MTDSAEGAPAQTGVAPQKLLRRPRDRCVGVLAYTESPLLQAVFSDLTGNGSARSAFGAFFAVSFGVGSLWMAVIAWIVTAAGFPVAFAVMAGSFLAAAAVVQATVRDSAV